MESVKELCRSLRKDFESWVLVRKDDPNKNYKFCLSVGHKKSKIGIAVYRETNYASLYSNKVVFSKNSSVHLGKLSWWNQWMLWRAIKACQHKQIKQALKPKRRIKRGQKMFCPNCGEKILFDVIEKVMEEDKNES